MNYDGLCFSFPPLYFLLGPKSLVYSIYRQFMNFMPRYHIYIPIHAFIFFCGLRRRSALDRTDVPSE